MNKIILALASMMLFAGTTFAQKLLSPSYTYSHKKTSYITLKDGVEITGTIKKLDRKKGLIEQIEIEKEDGQKVKFKADDIQKMYLPQSGLDNVNQALDAMTDVQKWNNQQIDQDLLDDGYVYFENAMVYYKKKKKMELLMQLLNPTFSKEVKVFHDPRAAQTMSVGVSGLTLAGAQAKSYYVKIKGGEAAHKLKKKNYDEQYERIWEGCDELLDSTSRAWRDLSSM